jgi:hypothetical protein
VDENPGSVTWQFNNTTNRTITVVLFRGAAAAGFSPYYYGNSFWPVYNVWGHMGAWPNGNSFAQNLNPLGTNILGPQGQSANLGLVHFSGQVFMVAFLFPIGPGTWETIEGGFPAPANNFFCMEVSLETTGNFALTFDPAQATLADSSLGTNSPGFQPDPGIFTTLSTVPVPANPIYVENFPMSYAQLLPVPPTPMWHDWESLGSPQGQSINGPAAASWGPNRLDVFAQGATDFELKHIWWDGAWSAWESLGGSLTSDPAAVSWGPGTIDVFARGPDNALWHNWYFNGWRGWESMGAPVSTAWNGTPIHDNGPWQNLSPPPGGGLTSKPAVVSTGPGQLTVFVQANSPANPSFVSLWALEFSNDAWGLWQYVGDMQNQDVIVPGTSPAAVSSGNGQIDILEMGQLGLWHQSFSNGLWGTWNPLAPPIVGLQNSPAISSWGPGRLDVFDRSVAYGRLSSDCSLWHLWFDQNQGGWVAWESLGGQITSDPSAVSWADNRIDVFTRGNDLTLWHQWFG